MHEEETQRPLSPALARGVCNTEEPESGTTRWLCTVLSPVLPYRFAPPERGTGWLHHVSTSWEDNAVSRVSTTPLFEGASTFVWQAALSVITRLRRLGEKH